MEMTSNNYKKLSVLIPAYNEQKTVARMLDKVKAVRTPLDKEIVVIDNNSHDDTNRLVSDWISGNRDINAKLLVCRAKELQ